MKIRLPREKICTGCGKKFEKGYYIIDEFSKGHGYLCPECFARMCFNHVSDRLVGIMKVSKDTLTFEFSLKESKK